MTSENEYLVGKDDPAQKAISVEGYIQRLEYDSNSLVIYIGLARPGSATSDASWQIRKFTYSGFNVTQVDFAGGTTAFSQIWDNRASLTYT